MGCFSSKNKSASPLPVPRSPPPYLLEETVKEVLSETPKLRSTTPRLISETQNKIASLHQNVENFEEINATRIKKNHQIDNPEEVSEISEINSCVSESYSTTTDRRDDEEFRRRFESPEKIKRRAYSGELHGRRVANSPARRLNQPSPNRARIVPGREKRVDNVKEMKPIRDAGESSRRRSRSPVIRNDNVGSRQNMGRSPSVRKTGKSPGRVRSDLSENTRRGEASNNNKEGKWPPTSNELLENPLVSLECFIFL